MGLQGSSWCGAVPACGSTILPFQCVNYSISIAQGDASGSRISQWYLVYGELLVGILVRETSVGNDLCHHLNYITLYKTLFLSLQPLYAF